MPKRFVKVATQGRSDSPEWVTQFTVQYSVDGINWQAADDGRIFQANTDQNSIVTNTFEKPFIASVVRICPTAWNSHISMRLELYYIE